MSEASVSQPEFVNPPHDTFQAWRLAHPRGFVLNASKTLHVAKCKHFGAPTRPGVEGKWNLGTTDKVCDTSRAVATGGRPVKPCQSCRP